MAQPAELLLKDDCFAYDGDKLMPVSEAMAILDARIARVVEAETVPLTEALGRVLAEDLVSDRNVPPHDNAALDGFAVHFDDLTPGAETRLPVTGRAAAGHPLGRAAKRGEAIRIFTGAPMPAGPDTVYMEEDCRIEDGKVVLPAGIKRGANRRFAGEDIKDGSVIIPRGRSLRAQEVGLAASIGRSKLSVWRRLRVAVFSTGDEVRDPGGTAPEGCIFDANRFSVMALLRGLGCAVTDLGILPDNFEAIRAALAGAAAGHDLLITSGGMSRGEEDHVKAAVEALGRLHFWRLAMKPGRPVALGQVAGTAFVGLPGNPVAVMVTFMCVARHVILRLSGRSDVDAPTYRVRAAFSYKKKKGRREWLRARLIRAADGSWEARRFPREGAGILTSMVESDGLVDLGEDQGPVGEGAMVDFLPFSGVTA
jgi:molybdopterin molybdotransferase